ncbi:MAG: alcohol dehydrogenase catalytic domain-containing protein [Carbonactinosporaceae bacterium]
MQAVVYTGPQELRYQEVDDPHPAPGEVVIAVTACGICGSELRGVASGSPFRVPPLIMGHEFTGRRADTGARVAVNPLVACLDCDLCLRGQANLCRDRVLLGIQRAGGFAERVAVPERNLYPVGDDVPAEAGTVVEPLANAIHAWRLPAERNPQRVGIIGAGTMGLVSLLVARSRGVPEVEVCDLADERLAVADRLGASRVGPALGGEYDLVIDAVGVEATRRDSVARTRPGGSAVWIGLHDEEPGFASLPFIRLEKAVHGTFCYTHADFEAAIRLAARVDTSWVTTVPLAEGAAVFGELMRGRSDLLKVQLVP